MKMKIALALAMTAAISLLLATRGSVRANDAAPVVLTGQVSSAIVKLEPLD